MQIKFIKRNAYANFDKLQTAALMRLGIPLSKASSLPSNILQALTQADTNYKDPQYVSEINSVLYKNNAITSGSPVYGAGKYSSLVRLYRYGDRTNPEFPQFIANFNSDRQNDINKAYMGAKFSNTDIADYLQDHIKSLDTISSITQAPLSQVENTFKATYQNAILKGASDSDAQNMTTDLINGYMNTSNYDVGDNYLVPLGTFQKEDVSPVNRESYTNNLINLTLHSLYINKTGKPPNVDMSTYIKMQKRRYGKATDYTLVFSNGSYLIKNNHNGLMWPVNPTAWKAVKDMQNELTTHQQQFDRLFIPIVH